jgi:hypothetical protein
MTPLSMMPYVRYLRLRRKVHATTCPAICALDVDVCKWVHAYDIADRPSVRSSLVAPDAECT